MRTDAVIASTRLMDDFYKTVLKKSIDMDCVDVNAIGD